MFSVIQNWWHSRIIKRSTVQDHQWTQAFQQLPILDGLSEPERERLRELAILFLHYKSLEGAHGLNVTQNMSLIIALQACLPILKLGMQWYDGWVSVIVYPSEFVPDRVYVDEIGLAHQSDSVLSGESWGRGPVIISWEHSQHAGVADGHNLIIHEFTHKLDLLNGVANGFPPLHRDMSPARWSRVMAEAFADFQHKVNSRIHLPIDDYAATSPAEFFAVISEVFFERPDILQTFYPHVCEQFKLFYRQDPLARMPASQW
jgi:Mlc titration factor MtfA (ptsG expression regulator)